MPIITLSRDVMLDILDSKDVVEDTIVDQSRWETQHSLVFKYEGKVYSTWYSIGSTECQDNRPWEDTNEIECQEVKHAPITVMAWVPIEEGEST